MRAYLCACICLVPCAPPRTRAYRRSWPHLIPNRISNLESIILSRTDNLFYIIKASIRYNELVLFPLNYVLMRSVSGRKETLLLIRPDQVNLIYTVP